MEEKNNIEKNAIEIFKILIDSHYQNDQRLDLNFDSEINNVIKYLDIATEMAYRLDKNTNEKYVIYCEDVVVLSIDGGKPELYYLSNYDGITDKEAIDFTDNSPEIDDLDEDYIICATDDLGLNLLGKRVGDKITFSKDDEKNQHTAVILSNKRTTLSYKLTREQVEAEYEQDLVHFYDEDEDDYTR